MANPLESAHTKTSNATYGAIENPMSSNPKHSMQLLLVGQDALTIMPESSALHQKDGDIDLHVTSPTRRIESRTAWARARITVHPPGCILELPQRNPRAIALVRMLGREGTLRASGRPAGAPISVTAQDEPHRATPSPPPPLTETARRPADLDHRPQSADRPPPGCAEPRPAPRPGQTVRRGGPAAAD